MMRKTHPSLFPIDSQLRHKKSGGSLRKAADIKAVNKGKK